MERMCVTLGAYARMGPVHGLQATALTRQRDLHVLLSICLDQHDLSGVFCDAAG